MPYWLARAIAWVLETLIWLGIGCICIGYLAPRFLFDWPLNAIVLVGFALLGPWLYRIYGLPKWYKGPW